MRRGVSMPKMLNVQIPPYFRCPISLDLMRDPVILSTGQTYDRASIEKWVADGNTTCPATMQQLKDFTLIPNHTLRRLIQDWCVANRSKGVERIPTPKQPADPQRVEALLLDSSSSNPNRASQFFALKVLRGLAKESDKNRLLIAEKGAFETLVTAFFNGNFPTEREEKTGISDSDPPKYDQELIEEALGLLVLLHMNELNGAAISKPNQLAMVSWLLNKGSMEGRINAASLVEKLSSLNEELKNSLGTTGGIIEGLVKLMKEPMYPRSVKIGVKALFSLCLSTSSKIGEKAVAAGAPEALVEHLPEAQKGDAERTLATLELLCKTVSGRAAVGSHALAIPALSKMVLRVSDQATECAAGTLYSICTASNCAQRAAVQAGVFTQMLLVIQSDCTVRAKRKAMDLLKLLKSCWTEDPCVSEFGRTNIVAF